MRNLLLLALASLVPVAGHAADPKHPRHKVCVHYLTCESPYCGEQAYQKCLRGEDPTGFSPEQDEFSSENAPADAQ